MVQKRQRRSKKSSFHSIVASCIIEPTAMKPTKHLLSILPLFSTAYLLFVGVNATNEEGTKFLEAKSKETDVITLPSGLRYKILEKGQGAFHPMIDTPCLCHYAGTLIDGTEFDSSYSRGSPSTFAPNQVIKGWTEAMQKMVEGDKWELYIPSELAYGERGSPPKIPGDSALVFTIEMIEIKGEKVIALKCDVSSLKDCDDRMKVYIQKTNKKYGGDTDEIEEEIQRLMGMNAKSMKEDLRAWIDTRIFLLQQMVMKANIKENTAEGKEEL